MYEIIKNVLESGRFELTAILKKIDTIWIQGDLTDEQKSELVELAQTKADPINSYAPLQEQLDKAFEQIKALEGRIVKLETGESTEPTEPADEYPDYKQPIGAHDAYYYGDTVTWKNKKYICIAPEGTACVWDPDTYPAFWQSVD